MPKPRKSSGLPLAVRLEYLVLEVAFIVLVAMNAVNVFARYVLNHSIGSLFELMILLAIAVYWLGVATSERTQGHLGMSFVVSRLPAGLRKLTELLRVCVIVAFLVVAAYSGAMLAIGQIQSRSISGTLGMPLWIFSIFIPLGCLLMLLRVLRPSPVEPRAAT